MENKEKAVQLRIDLKGSKPPIWRRVSVPIDYTFAQLHEIIQLLFGWQGYHIHQFDIPSLHLRLQESITDDDIFINFDKTMEFTNRVDLSNLKAGEKCSYIYDFGDWWEHTIKVEKIIEQKEDYPILLTWRQDNTCEDAGDIYGYYDKLQYLEKNNHPDVEDIRSWFAMQHTDFDEEYVQSALKNIHKEGIKKIQNEDRSEEAPFVDAMRDMLRVFDYVNEDALFHFVMFDHKEWYVWLHEGEELRNIRIFDNAYDCAISCLYEHEDEHTNPLFTNGIVFWYPNLCDEYEDEENSFDALISGKYGFQCYGNFTIQAEEIDSFMDFVCNVLYSIVDAIEGDHVVFPNILDELKCILIQMHENQMMEITYEEFELVNMKEKIMVEPSKIDAIAPKKNTDALYMFILKIPNLLHDEIEEDDVYALVLKGKCVEEVHLFEKMDIASLGSFIAQHLFSYMEERGKPAHLYCNDERIRQMLHTVCKQIRLPLDYRSIDFLTEKDVFTKALKLQNPPELYDEQFLDTVEEKLQNKEGTEDIGKLLQKYMRYMTYDTYRNEEEEM